jgi:hypothetical protein
VRQRTSHNNGSQGAAVGGIGGWSVIARIVNKVPAIVCRRVGGEPER